LPPPNPYIARDLSLRELPADSSTHALLGASVRVREQVGKQLQWYNGTVTQFNRSTSSVKVAYEGGIDAWLKLDDPSAQVYKGSVVTLAKGSIQCRVLAGPPNPPRKHRALKLVTDGGEGERNEEGNLEGGQNLEEGENRDLEGGENDENSEEEEENEEAIWATFPHVPHHVAALEPVEWKSGSGSTPSSTQVRVFYLQDRVFRVPKLEAYVFLITNTDMASRYSKLESEPAATPNPDIPGPTPTHSVARAVVLTDMLLHLVQDSITDDSYMAEMAGLRMQFSRIDCGIQLHVEGFSDKLLVLLRRALSSLFMALPGRMSSEGAEQAQVGGVTSCKGSTPTTPADSTELRTQGTDVDGKSLNQPKSRRRRRRRKGGGGGGNQEGELSDAEPGPFDPTRLRNMIDSRRRTYLNAGNKAADLASSLRLACLLPTEVLQHARLAVMDEIGDDVDQWARELRKHSRLMFEHVNAHVLVHGNANTKDVKALSKVVAAELRNAKAKPLTRLPARSVLVVPTEAELKQRRGCVPLDAGLAQISINEISDVSQVRNNGGNLDLCMSVVTRARMASSKNSSVEVYMQADQHDSLAHATMDLIDLIMEEPLYNELRTKQQLGYSVSCGPRSTVGILGFVVSVTSAAHESDTLVIKVSMKWLLVWVGFSLV
jgi:hypothetical protein